MFLRGERCDCAALQIDDVVLLVSWICSGVAGGCGAKECWGSGLGLMDAMAWAAAAAQDGGFGAMHWQPRRLYVA